MTLSVFLSSAARAELISAAEWYDSETPGVGGAFTEAIGLMIARIGRSPLQFPRWSGDPTYRRAVLRRFPFSIFFAVEGESIQVVSIAHVRRRPGYWR